MKSSCLIIVKYDVVLPSDCYWYVMILYIDDDNDGGWRLMYWWPIHCILLIWHWYCSHCTFFFPNLLPCCLLYARWYTLLMTAWCCYCLTDWWWWWWWCNGAGEVMCFWMMMTLLWYDCSDMLLIQYYLVAYLLIFCPLSYWWYGVWQRRCWRWYSMVLH